MDVTRGYTTEDGGRLNNFAVEPRMYVEESSNAGFTPEAEKLNGRLAMIGFVALLMLEASTGKGLVGWLTGL
ncbi:MAG: high light inducible protein [Oscillatoriales cyanobacterium RM1_1_9]|nr:high light inducible protein [Oscillatoriales cyanobacterium SM2_3_0]NJO46834.1 high light inducible protein [Oscillatoriales cyanobacterium RM2_1_1]NJO72129.1 high light inducible protein [Oscillatoriales cyanobacterium RM1_1_9]